MENELTFDIETDELEIFVEEVNEHLQAIESGILLLEQAADAQTIHSVFRAAHTIKALAGTVGHHRMAELTHTMETLFDAMREGKLSVTQTVADDLFATVDVLKALRDEIITGRPSDVDVGAFLARLRTIIEGDLGSGIDLPEVDSVSEEKLNQLTPEQTAQVQAYYDKGYNILEVEARTTAETFAAAARLSQAAMVLMEVGEVVAQHPPLADLGNGQHDHRLWAICATQTQPEKVETLLADVSDLARFQVRPYKVDIPVSVSDPAAITQVPVSPVTSELPADKTVRISVERLDTLMNLVGELVTDRNRLLQIEDTLRVYYSKEGVFSELGEMTGHIGRVVDQLQEEVMRARMLPIAHIFNKLPRLVRDVSRTAGKMVNLVTEGEDTELDRSLIEFIGDPLIHLLRNAVDHGVEAPEARIAVGKPPAGRVRLTAAHEEGHIIITVEDDGQGIDPERVRRSALSRGLRTEEEVAQLSDDAAIDLIFYPNLSTAEKVTEVSGRGVGMDVVRSNIERLGGTVTVESEVGRGATFRITLPLTLAILQSMLVALRNTTFAIPLTSIVESLYLSDVTVSTVKGSPVILWRDSVLPLLDLRQYFAVPHHQSNEYYPATTGAKTAVVTVAWGKQRVGLLVDRIMGKQDIVVKSLNPIMGELPGISGGTILGDGNIALIVDIPDLINTTLETRRQGIAV